MKKMMMILMMVFGMSAVFAYEPKKECAKIKRNGDIEYHEQTEPYKSFPWDEDYKDYVNWVIREDHTVEQLDHTYFLLGSFRKSYTVDQFVSYEYSVLEDSRKRYYFGMEKVTNPEPDDFEIAMTKLINKVDGTSISPEEYARSRWLEYAEDEITCAVTSLAFVTEKNYLTLTKEDLYEKVNDFIEEAKAENK